MDMDKMMTLKNSLNDLLCEYFLFCSNVKRKEDLSIEPKKNLSWNVWILLTKETLQLLSKSALLKQKGYNLN